MLVKDILRGKTKTIVTANDSMPIDKAMALLVEHNIGCLPIVDKDQKLVGLITDRAIFKKINEMKDKYLSLTVGDVMTSELVSGEPGEDIAYVAEKMRKRWVRHVPIIEDNRITGIISLWDILKAKAQTEVENRYLKLCLNEQFNPSRAGDD